MFKKFILNKALYLVLMAILIAADQLSKIMVLEKFSIIENKIMIINNFINVVLTFNKGISFSMLSQFDARYIIISITMIITFYLFYLFAKSSDKMQDYCLTLIISGATGNIMDRFTHGAVIDFIDIHYNDYHWPAFNLADCLIAFGVLFLIINMLLNQKDTINYKQ